MSLNAGAQAWVPNPAATSWVPGGAAGTGASGTTEADAEEMGASGVIDSVEVS